MKVIKIGGGCLKGKNNIKRILELIAAHQGGHIFVLSALHGITDILVGGIPQALENDGNIPAIINRLKNRHMLVARYLLSPGDHLKDFSRDLNKTLTNLERYYYGLNFTKEITPRLRDVICSFGERIAVKLMVSALCAKGLKAAYREPDKIGLITDGKFGDATANIPKTRKNFQKNLAPLLKNKQYLFIPGFFGVGPKGDLTTFGRGGSDYSAAVVAAAMQSDSLEIWKDVAGFMSADPQIIPQAKVIPVLSYEEAAELSYFGAKILHPRTVEPARKSRLNIVIKDFTNLEAPGSLVTTRSPKSRSIIKSVTHNSDIGIIKIHASGVGARPGILAQITNQLSDIRINIKSVVTSQTCISLLLGKEDLENGYHALQSLKPKPYRQLEKIKNVALVSIVGEGLFHHKGIAARCFTAVAQSNVNIEMISFGPSKVALYFLLRNQDLKKAINAIHNTFFSESPPEEND